MYLIVLRNAVSQRLAKMVALLGVFVELKSVE
jgi:hypothetical protein